ncbi:DUF952 domain-containing protein [Ruminiclostridium papyrosolvens]|uniref:Glutathione S-transferase n=1 Tax=Ruminiclostridium papyrosolvens C7 TaxID=1330534 RepID=U4R0Q9_9FIRM|nr:DUF952 domain-containing protein [Ruminiclostridium papyrosolvens]EPR11495.1 hypothetical protein L323_11870 [Ruminiclostridium papyrosolvens C7]
MIILHCMKENSWKKVKEKQSFGLDSIEAEGFIHCSSIGYFWRVAPNFKHIEEDLVLLCIETDKLQSKIRWEDGDNCGRYYPHIYGQINIDSVVHVLPFLKDINGDFIKNEELQKYKDE